MRVLEVTTQGTQGTQAPGTQPDNDADTSTTTTTPNGSTVGQPQTEPTSNDMGSEATPAQRRQEVQQQIQAKTDQITQTRERARAAQEQIQAAKEAEKMANDELALLRKRLASIR